MQCFFSFYIRARLVDYLFPMSKVLKIRVGRSGKKKIRKKKKKAEVPIIGYQISLFVTEMLPMPWQEVQICVHDVHETHFPLYYSSACSYRKLCRFEKCWIRRLQQKQIIQTFYFIYFIQNAVLRRKRSSSGQGRSESKKKIFFFFRVGPKNRVGRDMGNR